MRYLKNNCLSLVIGLLTILFTVDAYSQIVVKGPNCVLPGELYHYAIEGQWDSLTRVTVCITGGRLEDDEICTPRYNAISDVFVIWGTDVAKSIRITTSTLDTVITIQTTSLLDAGKQDTLTRVQVVENGTASYVFSCSTATGGYCDPEYNYQWQASVNELEWQDIAGATEANLTVNMLPEVTNFYRRKVFEVKSNTTAFSDTAILVIVTNQ